MAEVQQSIIDDLNTTTESWRSFRIMGEMVNSFESLNEISQSGVSIFGSARAKPGEKAYEDAVTIAKGLGENGFAIITGGGPGIMEAANKGAVEAGAPSIGLHIHLPHEQGCNQYVRTRCDFRYFFLRKFMFVKYSHAYVVMPGGMGTIDEFSEAFVLAQTRRIKPFPIILYDKKFWSGLIKWLKTNMVASGYITEAEVDKYAIICDTPEEVVKYVTKYVL